MNRNVLIVLAGGFLIAVLVALLVQAALKGGDEPQQVAVKEEPRVEIAVASQDIKIGDEVGSENVSWQEWPEKAVFPGAIIREEEEKVTDVISGRVSRDVSTGEPLSQSALVGEGGATLSELLKPGMRAYTVSANATTMVAGFAGPGDYVDIILTYRQRVTYDGPENEELERVVERNINNLATETILQNVKILAVDQTNRRSSGSDDKKKKGDSDTSAKVGKNITLEVTPKEAEILAVAADLGDLSLALRGIGDDAVIATPGPVTTDARVTRAYDDVLEELDKASGAMGNGQVIRIYRGDNIEDFAVSQ